MLKWLKNFFGRKVGRKDNHGKEETEIIRKENPFLPELRNILEQLLHRYNLTYRDFAPLLIDTDTPPESLLIEDDAEQVLEQISCDLNFLRIATERPAYFSYYIEKMYEENGLIVQMESKEKFSLEGVNVVLDMEQKGKLHCRCIQEKIHYIPVYKKPWNQGENLDILVPIGYNTVIVKGQMDKNK